jgi:DNA-binding LacI/PurR family transcriptional regulator/DNA-binding transcriptional regulator YhcF (GntR family)
MKFQVYERTISYEKKKDLPGLVAKTLRQEIISGRWSIGERLPSLIDLEKMTGLGRYPVQAALGQLEDEGYIEKVNKKGIFLKSRKSVDNPAREIYSILIPSVQSYDSDAGVSIKSVYSFGNWCLSHLQSWALENGFRTELIVVGDSGDNFSAEQISKDSVGIISFVSQSHMIQKGYDLKEFPCVFIGVEDRMSRPCITGDIYLASRLMTRRMIQCGHQNILLYTLPNWGEVEAAEFIEGYRSEMECAALEFDDSLFQRVNGVDMSSMKEFLCSYPEATAVILPEPNLAHRFLELVDLLDYKVPEEMSLACLNVVRVPWKNSSFVIDGCFYKWEDIFEKCFEVLLQRNKYLGLSRINFTPLTEDGDSIRDWNQ